ncbi:MAG TPA: hypothetical protein VIN39_06435 [Candidatus Dormibacteraeota bacterium]|jgi:hypothetical protein
MFGSTKVKVAAGLAAGALTLGAAGAYAAANSDSVSLATAKPVTLTGASAPKLISLSGNTTLTLPAKFKNQGECVSTFAKNKDLAIAPAAGATKLSKNYHGKLMSTIKAWCQSQLSKTTTSTDTQTTDSADVTESSAPSTDATDSQSSQGQAHANAHANGHGHGRGSSNS